jgi:antitoxin component YwqK of YwqJK toxin-antitoxin module
MGFFISSFSQIPDTMFRGKLVNYNRQRKYNDHEQIKWSYEDNKLRTRFGKMSRLIVTNPSDQLAEERVYINEKFNGLSVKWWPSGLVKSVDYYFEDRLWETISRTDSSGKLLNPGTLVNGNGLVYKYALDGKVTATTTYKDGYPTGPYSQIGKGTMEMFVYGVGWGDTVLTEGSLAYKPSCVNYFPAIKIKYINGDLDTSTLVVLKEHYEKVYSKKEYFDFQVLETSPDLLMQLPTTNHYLNLNFTDPATIPTGKWKVYDNTDKKTVLFEVDHDDNGNAIRIVTYSNGKKVKEYTFPPCGKRKIPVMNDDGSFREEKCL